MCLLIVTNHRLNIWQKANGGKYEHVHVFVSYLINGLENRDKRLRLFMKGDYEFFSRIYGLTGAEGIVWYFNVMTSYT